MTMRHSPYAGGIAESSSSLGAIDLTELHQSTTIGYRTFTVTRTSQDDHSIWNHDFLTLISLICDLYRVYKGELLAMQPFQHGLETFESSGNSCIVTRRAVTVSMPSNTRRGQTLNSKENIVVKRVHQGVLERDSPALKSFITELRVRAHPPLRTHPNIVDLRGVAWDFEDDEREKPRPLLLEELASEGSLGKFSKEKNLTRMPFQVKADLAMDIAQGLVVLHECGIVHGDVKPDNILIFPHDGFQKAFTAKLTDFGHSVFAFEGRTSLPAFTLPYSAPEATIHLQLTFEDMKRTDVYSYGLVLLSLFVGRDCCADLGDVLASYKSDDTMSDYAMELVEKEDRVHRDSDLDLATLRSLFMNTVRRETKKRDLENCIKLLMR